MSKLKVIVVLMLVFTLTGDGFAAQDAKTGFLILAPDRGFVGNEETNALFNKFKNEYPASLALQGRGYGGTEDEYSKYTRNAIADLVRQNVSNIVVLPLFLSDSDSLLKKARADLSTYKNSGKLDWAESMSKSYLTAQILLDRVSEISKTPEQEQLVVLGMGAVDEKSEQNIREELGRLTAYVKARKPFQEVQVAVYYNRASEKELRKKKNKEADETVIHTAASKGDALLVPFFIGPKFSHMMSMTHWMGRKFETFDLTYNPKTVLPHPNVLTWMKKTANQFIRAKKDQVGVVIMPHGATQPYNDAVEKTIEPLRKKYRIEMAYGMGDPKTIQKAISRLERQGIRKIAFVRMYSLSGQMKDKTDYILGLRNKLPDDWKGPVPPQVRTGAVIKSFGGYEEDTLIAEILLERIREVSKRPSEETIVLLAHGSGNDRDDQAWRNTMKNNIDWIQKHLEAPFKDIVALTLREDWEDKRQMALKEIRQTIDKASKSGKVLIISNRLHGSGPYNRFLKGLNYQMNAKGLAPHPNLTRWLERGIETVVKTDFLVTPMAATGTERFSQVSPEVLFVQ